MVNKRVENITEKELDGLMKRAFLDLGDDHSNDIILDHVAQHAMSGHSTARIIRLYTIDVIFVLLAAIICQGGSDQRINSALPAGPTMAVPLPPVSMVEKGQTRVESSAVKSVSDNETLPVKGRERSVSSPKSGVKTQPEKKVQQGISSVPDKRKDAQEATVLIEPVPVSVPVTDTMISAAVHASVAMVHIGRSTGSAPAIKRVRPVREPSMLSSGKKGRSEVRRVRKLFKRNGTFILRGRKYGKVRLR